MKRRVLSLIIALALCLDLFPAVGSAADEGTGDGLCPHHPAHTDACGYVPGDPGAPCAFGCRICPLRELIDELPGDVSTDNSEQVQAQLDEIFALYDELTEDEQGQVDLSPCAALLEQMDGMGAAELSDNSTGEKVQTWTVNENTTLLDCGRYRPPQCTI